MLLNNRGSVGSDVTLKAADIGRLDGPKVARNLWQQQDSADFRTELQQHLQPHQTVLLKISG